MIPIEHPWTDWQEDVIDSDKLCDWKWKEDTPEKIKKEYEKWEKDYNKMMKYKI